MITKLQYTAALIFAHHKRIVKNINATYNFINIVDSDTVAYTPAANDVVLAAETATIFGVSMLAFTYYRYDGSSWLAVSYKTNAEIDAFIASTATSLATLLNRTQHLSANGILPAEYSTDYNTFESEVTQQYANAWFKTKTQHLSIEEGKEGTMQAAHILVTVLAGDESNLAAELILIWNDIKNLFLKGLKLDLNGNFTQNVYCEVPASAEGHLIRMLEVLNITDPLQDKTKKLDEHGNFADNPYQENPASQNGHLVRKLEFDNALLPILAKIIHLNSSGYPDNAPNWRIQLGLGTAATLNLDVSGGVPSLDSGGKIKESQLPARPERNYMFSYATDVQEFITNEIQWYITNIGVNRNDVLYLMTVDEHFVPSISSMWILVENDPLRDYNWASDSIQPIDWGVILNRPDVLLQLAEDASLRLTHRGKKVLTEDDNINWDKLENKPDAVDNIDEDANYNLIHRGVKLIKEGDIEAAETQMPRLRDDAQLLLDHLHYKKNNNVIMGHHATLLYGSGNSNGDPWSGSTQSDYSDVKFLVGEHAGMFGVDFGRFEISSDPNPLNINWKSWNFIKSKMDQAAAKGMLIEVSWHCFCPQSGLDPWQDPTDVVFPDIFYRDTATGSTFYTYLERLAEKFKALDYPVLFRPFHEHSGSHFWWGTLWCSEGEYILLYKYVRDTLRELGANNLLYVFSPYVDNYQYGYPGDNYVDVGGAEARSYGTTQQDQLVNAVNWYKAKNKLFAIGEFQTENAYSWSANQWQDAFNLLSTSEVTQEIIYLQVWRNQTQVAGGFDLPFKSSAWETDIINALSLSTILLESDVLALDYYNQNPAITPQNEIGSGGGQTTDVQAAIDAANSPSASNPVATMNDVGDAGGGDMMKAVYDPNSKNDDAFDVDNHEESTTRKFASPSQLSKVDSISDTGSGEIISTDERSKVGNLPSNTNTELAAKQATSEKGQANGYAELDGAGLVPSAQLPSFVDDVIEAADFASLPGTGEGGKIYVTLDDNITYRWSGSAYVEISKSLAIGILATNAFRGDWGNLAYQHSQADHSLQAAFNLGKIITMAGADSLKLSGDDGEIIDFSNDQIKISRSIKSRPSATSTFLWSLEFDGTDKGAVHGMKLKGNDFEEYVFLNQIDFTDGLFQHRQYVIGRSFVHEISCFADPTYALHMESLRSNDDECLPTTPMKMYRFGGTTTDRALRSIAVAYNTNGWDAATSQTIFYGYGCVFIGDISSAELANSFYKTGTIGYDATLGCFIGKTASGVVTFMAGANSEVHPNNIGDRVATITGEPANINMESAEYFKMLTCNTDQQFSISNPIVLKACRLKISGGTLEATDPIFSGYNIVWWEGQSLSDYTPASENVLWFEVQEGGTTINLMWGQ